MERDPPKRFGCKPHGEGYQELRRHAWFKSIDWDTLESKEQISPFIPDAKKANFDASHELEELLLEDNPLKAKQRKANQDNFSPEMRQMEEQYVPILSRFLSTCSTSCDTFHPLVHLERLGSLDEEVVRFYVAQLSSAVQFLHDNNIMHRDIKPDNILLDERGNAHLTDFNIGLKFTERRLMGVAGSMAYMAPECVHIGVQTSPTDLA